MTDQTKFKLVPANPTPEMCRSAPEVFPMHAAGIWRKMLAAAPPAPVVEAEYTNWRGERRLRKIQPVRVWFGSTEFHPAPQLLISALDEDGKLKDFSAAGFVAPAPVVEVTDEVAESAMAMAATEG